MTDKSKVRLFLVFWLFVLSTVAYLDRTNISIASVALMKEFGIDKIRLGWVLSAFLVGYAGFQIPAGWLADKYGPRLMLTVALVWWSVFGVATTLIAPALGDVLAQIIAVRFVLGMGESLMYPAANQFIASWIPPQERAQASAWLFAGVGVGAGLTPPVVTFIMLGYGWRASFWFSAIVGLAAAAVWYMSSRDEPENHPRVSAGELAYIRTELAKAPAKKQRTIPWRNFFVSKEVWLLTLSYFTFGYVAFIFLSWFFIYIADVRGVDLRTSALYAMMPFISMTVFCLLGGVVSDRLSQWKSPYVGRCMLGCVSMLAAALFLAFGSDVHDTLLACIVLAGGAGALYFAQSPYWAITADIAGPNTGIVSGIMNMGGQIAGAITSSLTPWIAAQYGWTAAFYVAAGLAVIGAVAWLFVDPDQTLAQGKDEAAINLELGVSAVADSGR